VTKNINLEIGGSWGNGLYLRYYFWKFPGRAKYGQEQCHNMGFAERISKSEPSAYWT